MDGDARGGAALSMRAVTGKPIKLVGTGEKVDALEEFHPARVASRILGMGDIVSLVEKAAGEVRPGGGAELADKMRKGKFDLEDMRDQLAQMQKMGGIGGMLGMLPGIGKMKEQLENANIDDRVIKRQRAIIDSMTPKERRNPDILKASRKKRIAAGSGAKVEEVNKLLKMHRQMADVMKMMGGGKGRGMAGALGNMFGIGKGGMGPGMGGMPQPTPEQIEAMQKQMGGGGGDRVRCPPVSVAPRACRVFLAWVRKVPVCRASAASRSGEEEMTEGLTATELLKRANALAKQLKDMSIWNEIRVFRKDGITILARVPGAYWEIDLLDDGMTNVEVLRSSGEMDDEFAIERLISEYGEKPEH